MRRLRLDQVWLLVSPGNPLKPRAGMAPFADRLAGARADRRRPPRLASGIEAAFGTRYTVDTMRLLMRRFPRTRFVWIMGADILEQIAALAPMAGYRAASGVRGAASAELFASGACGTGRASATGEAPAGAGKPLCCRVPRPGGCSCRAGRTPFPPPPSDKPPEGASAITKPPKVSPSPARHKPAPRKNAVKPKLPEAGVVPGSPRKKTIAAGPKKAAAGAADAES